MAIMTEEGRKALEEEKYRLEEAIKVAQQNKSQAAEMGDLSENAEFEAAKNELSQLTIQLSAVMNKLSSDVIIDNGTEGNINIGSRIRVYDITENEENQEFREFVFKEEGDTVIAKVIGLNSQLGQSIYNRSPGKFTLPCGKVYRVELANG